jgi:hypothetical protein
MKLGSGKPHENNCILSHLADTEIYSSPIKNTKHVTHVSRYSGILHLELLTSLRSDSDEELVIAHVLLGE